MMLHLYLESPFAVCRTFTAGWYRPTATFITPSAAYGLLLNLAGIESRLREQDEQHPGTEPTSLTRTGLPAMKIAVGAPAVRWERKSWFDVPLVERYPRVQSMYQQLHNYPVGSSGGDRAATTYGNKYNITPVRREFLIDLRAVLAVNASPEFESLIHLGLDGKGPPGRYGLPFLGDNAMLIDRIVAIEQLPSVHWYQRVNSDNKVVPRATRLTTMIDRADMSKTLSELFAPQEQPSASIPDNAWTAINPPI